MLLCQARRPSTWRVPWWAVLGPTPPPRELAGSEKVPCTSEHIGHYRGRMCSLLNVAEDKDEQNRRNRLSPVRPLGPWAHSVNILRSVTESFRGAFQRTSSSVLGLSCGEIHTHRLSMAVFLIAGMNASWQESRTCQGMLASMTGVRLRLN